MPSTTWPARWRCLRGRVRSYMLGNLARKACMSLCTRPTTPSHPTLSPSPPLSLRQAPSCWEVWTLLTSATCWLPTGPQARVSRLVSGSVLTCFASAEDARPFPAAWACWPLALSLPWACLASTHNISGRVSQALIRCALVHPCTPRSGVWCEPGDPRQVHGGQEGAAGEDDGGRGWGGGKRRVPASIPGPVEGSEPQCWDADIPRVPPRGLLPDHVHPNPLHYHRSARCWRATPSS